MTASSLRLALLAGLLLPAIAFARTPQSGTEPQAGAAAQTATEPGADTTNVNRRYEVESAAVVGVRDTSISQALRDDVQQLVGRKYDPEAAEHLVHRLHQELPDYRIRLRVRRGEHAERLKVVFEAERIHRPPFDLRMSPLLYTNNDAVSLALVPSFETHHNYFAYGYLTESNDLLERNIGWMVRYEHRKVGTSAVQLGLEYDYFHPRFRAETENALALSLLVPGIYRRREVFSPSISVLPVPDLKVTFGASFQTLEMQYPSLHDEAAHAATLGVQYRKEVRPRRGLRHSIGLDYALRDATTRLSSDFTYTRHWAAADYLLRLGRQDFEAQFQGGRINGTAPLFERFSIGSATTLRGWDKFDVAPLGGTRLLYGSLTYRYRPFEVFYDFGTVWDTGQSEDWKHSIGAGLAWKNGFFMSIGVPLRFHGVTPAFMMGFRY